MKTGLRGVLVVLLAVPAAVLCTADTLTNKATREVLHGYMTSRTDVNGVVAYTAEKGSVPIAPDQWDITPNRLGRNNTVIIITLEEQLSLQIAVEALEQAITSGADQGPLFILLEMNSPGGQAPYVERICDRLTRTAYCPVFVFVKGGRYGGAVSSAAAIALACDKILMAPNTAIGAATILDPAYGLNSQKLSVAWQEYLATLAGRKGRPRLLVRAMVDKDVEVVEVIEAGNRRFIEPRDAEPNQTVVRTWSRAGSLLTLTAAEAVDSGIAEAIVADRQEVLRKLDGTGAQIVIDDSVGEAVRTFRKVRLKFARLRNALDGQIKRIEQTDNLEEAINLLREIRAEYKSLLSLAKRYPDLYLDVELIEEQLGSAQDYYEQAKIKVRTATVDSNADVKRED